MILSHPADSRAELEYPFLEALLFLLKLDVI